LLLIVVLIVTRLDTDSCLFSHRQQLQITMFRLVTTFASLAPLASARGPAANLFARNSFATIARGGATEFETLAPPAPGSPFHYAFPVHDLNAAKEFYGSVLGCVEGRSSEKVGSLAQLLQEHATQLSSRSLTFCLAFHNSGKITACMVTKSWLTG
jgi:hypothetical protein